MDFLISQELKNKKQHDRLNHIKSNDSIQQHHSSLKFNNSSEYNPLFKPITKKDRMTTQFYGVPLQYQWLINTSARFDFHKKSSTLKLGPGSYNSNTNKKTNVYSFAKHKRFEVVQTQTGKIGPGNYDLSKQHKSIKINRSITKFNTNENTIVHNQIKNITPGPGEYSNQSPSLKNKDQQSTSVQFKSKIDRFKVHQNPHLGPGLYNQQGQFEQALKKIYVKKHYQLHVKTNKNTFQSPRMKTEKKSPGPGQYENSNTLTKYLKKRYKNGYKGDFGSKQNRFGEQFYSKTPGPGHYMKSKNRVELQSLSPPKPTSNFIQSDKPSIFTEKQTPFGIYDLSPLSMIYPLEKKKQHIQRLKNIDIEVPGFGSGAARSFRFEQSI